MKNPVGYIANRAALIKKNFQYSMVIDQFWRVPSFFFARVEYSQERRMPGTDHRTKGNTGRKGIPGKGLLFLNHKRWPVPSPCQNSGE